MLHNLARVSSATTGTGTLTLGAAVSGFLTFADAGVVDGETVTYAIRDGANSEIGRGVYTASGTTLSRAVIYESTNGGSAISCSGSQEVFITAAAESIQNSVSSRPYGALNRSYTFTSTVEDLTTPANGTLSVEDGGLKYVTTADVVATEPVGAADVADGELICDVKFTSGTDGGVAFRKSDDSNFYFLLMSSAAITLYKKVGGGYTSLSTTSPFLGSGVFHKVCARFVGTRITIYINDQLMISTTDSDLTTGKIGLRVNTGTMYLDHVKVYTLTAFDSRLVSH